MTEHPSKVTNTDEDGERHLTIVDSVTITEVRPIGADHESRDDTGRFEIRDGDALIWSIAYGPESRTRTEARRTSNRIAGAYSLGKRSGEGEDT